MTEVEVKKWREWMYEHYQIEEWARWRLEDLDLWTQWTIATTFEPIGEPTRQLVSYMTKVKNTGQAYKQTKKYFWSPRLEREK